MFKEEEYQKDVTYAYNLAHTRRQLKQIWRTFEANNFLTFICYPIPTTII